MIEDVDSVQKLKFKAHTDSGNHLTFIAGGFHTVWSVGANRFKKNDMARTDVRGYGINLIALAFYGRHAAFSGRKGWPVINRAPTSAMKS